MYETHFGLKKRPFRALALGNDVFIGPQTATAMAAVKKALSTSDAIAAVYGPIGVGKTTVIGRALDGVGEKSKIVPVGRIKLGHDEVLELLLGELGVEDLPAGTVQRFALFRRMLRKFDEDDSRVIIVVEDAGRIGADALAELEALTAADAGVSGGAGVVLMGDESLDELLKGPQLARLRQRLRLRQPLSPLTAKELVAYFKHCFRLAGGEFDSLFDGESGDLLHELSGGNPRMANNLVDSALAVAADNGEKRVSVQQLLTVAQNEYGLEVGERLTTHPAATVEPTIEPDPEPSAAKEQRPSAAQSVPAPPEDDIPELIQDTLPELEVLAPQQANARLEQPAAPAPVEPRVNARIEKAAAPPPVEPMEAEPPAAAEILRQEKAASDTLLPDHPPAPESPVGKPNEPVPDWERDPTLAELRPDLDALEHAMAVAHGDREDEEEVPVLQPAARPAATPEVVPEITLDREIQAKIEEAAEAIKRTEEAAAAKAAADAEAEKSIDIAATGEIQVQLPPLKSVESKSQPAVEKPPEPADTTPTAAEEDGKDNKEMERIASGLSRAKTLDDVDDKMAETLFGEEFSEIAAQVAGKVAESSANDEIELELEDEPAAEGSPTRDSGGNVAANTRREARPEGVKPQLDEAASKRLATVRALNGSANGHPPLPPSAESIVMSHEPASSQAQQSADHPQSIEDQINTSMTATLQALKSRPPGDIDDDDDKKGFFSRFRRS